MAGFDAYEIDPEGAYVFRDTSTGETLRSAPTPFAQEYAAGLKPLAPPAPAPGMQEPLQPVAMPDPIISAQGPEQTLRLAQEAPGAADQGAPGARSDEPPAPLPSGAGGAPAGYTPPPADSLGAGAGGASGASANTGGAQADEKPRIIRTGGGGPAGLTGDEVAAQLHFKEAEEHLRSSPGQFVPGGTFRTGMSIQASRGPDPGATLGREVAERRAGDAMSDLAHVEARKNLELTERYQEQERQAAQRQAQLNEIQAREQAKLGEVFGQIETTQKELADAKVDPGRKVKSMSTGMQILAAISMGLGIMGKAFTGGPGNPMAMDVFDQAIRDDIEDQKYAIEKKRGDLNALGQTYQLALSKFGNEKMAAEAAYLAGLEITKAKVQQTLSEAESAMSMDASGAPYSIKAKAILADLEAKQAAVRESLSQAVNGQVAEQYVTTQDKVVGGKGPNYAKAAEAAAKGAKLLGGDGQQQVNFGGAQYKLGKFVSDSEGGQLRKKFALIDSLKSTIAAAKQAKANLGDRWLKSEEFKDFSNTVAGMRSVLVEQGVLQGNEREEFQGIANSVLSGTDVLNNIDKFANRLGQGYLDQTGAKPLGAVGGGRGGAVPQRLQDVATGKVQLRGGGGVVGMPRPGGAPPPIVRSTGARATPLDVAQASAMQIGRDKRAVGATLGALGEALHTGQLGPREYEVAVDLAQDGRVDELRGFLSRMGGTVDVNSLGAPPRDPYMAMIGQRAAQAPPRGSYSVKVTTKAGK